MTPTCNGFGSVAQIPRTGFAKPLARSQSQSQAPTQRNSAQRELQSLMNIAFWVEMSSVKWKQNVRHRWCQLTCTGEKTKHVWENIKPLINNIVIALTLDLIEIKSKQNKMPLHRWFDSCVN